MASRLPWARREPPREQAPLRPAFRLLTTPDEVRAAREHAREQFVLRLRSGGLMVIPEVLERWWP